MPWSGRRATICRVERTVLIVDDHEGIPAHHPSDAHRVEHIRGWLPEAEPAYRAQS
jgi:hypothetical protein